MQYAWGKAWLNAEKSAEAIVKRRSAEPFFHALADFCILDAATVLPNAQMIQMRRGDYLPKKQRNHLFFSQKNLTKTIERLFYATERIASGVSCPITFELHVRAHWQRFLYKQHRGRLMKSSCDTTVVTAGDQAYSWGVFLLVASMRRNGMPQPVVVGAMDWTDKMKNLVLSLGNVTIVDVPRSRQCMACQKPAMMASDAVKTEWVCWVDSDGLFVGDCTEWLTGSDSDEVRIKRSDPPPPDFTPENLAIWQRDVKRFLGQALPESRYATRVQSGVILLHRKWRPFLARWDAQIKNVLPSDVGILMEKGSAYYQTDESVLSSLLCFDLDVPNVSETYKFDGKIDRKRFYAHFGYNPKPWQMWNSFASKWREETYLTVEWLVENDYVKICEVPFPLRRNWWPLYHCLTPVAPWVWRLKKLKRKLLGS